MKAPLLAFLGGCITSGLAEKDSKSYGGYTNPNVAYAHYWADPPNVLQDSSSFEKLYVKYHGCAWSEQSYSTQSSGNNGYAGNSCGQSGGDNSNSWYVGMGKCMGSNVAYSLYGVLPDDTFGRKESPCSSKTFINSFFTTDGLTSFVKASDGKVDTSAIYTQCEWYDNNKAYTATTGCSAKGQFTTDTFLGSGCLGYNYNDTVNELEELNANLTKMECTLIYSSDESVNNYASKLLTYSESCTIDGVNALYCPNPNGILTAYEYNFAMAQQNPNYTVTRTTFATMEGTQGGVAKLTTSIVLFITGAALFAGSAWQRYGGRKTRETYSEPQSAFGILA